MQSHRCYPALKCTKIDLNEQRRTLKTKDAFSIQFQRFYQERMRLNKIQKKDPQQLQDQLLRLYKDTLPTDRSNFFTLSIKDSSCQSPTQQRKKSLQTQRRASSFQGKHKPLCTQKETVLSNLLRISPKHIASRQGDRPKFDQKNTCKTIYLDALIFEDDAGSQYCF